MNENETNLRELPEILAIRPGFGHVEFDGGYFWVIELGFEAQHASSVGVRTYETALRHLRSM